MDSKQALEALDRMRKRGSLLPQSLQTPHYKDFCDVQEFITESTLEQAEKP